MRVCKAPLRAISPFAHYFVQAPSEAGTLGTMLTATAARENGMNTKSINVLWGIAGCLTGLAMIAASPASCRRPYRQS